MKQSIYEPTLYTLNGQLRIKAFTMERPKPPFIGTNGKEYMMNKFLASAIDYPVQEGSKEEILKWTESKYYPSPHLMCSYMVHEVMEQEGLRIDEIADRLEVFEISVLHREKQIRLLPEVKEESQNDLWIEAIKIFNKREHTQDGRNDLMKQFKIERR